MCRASERDDVLSAAPTVLRARRSGGSSSPTVRRKRERPGHAATVHSPAADSFGRWRLTNAERLTVYDLASGHAPGGYCEEHRRWLSNPEQKRGACFWCIPVDPKREPEYWASHWRRFKVPQ